MTIYLKLVKSAKFNGVTFDCYKNMNEQDDSSFWATREQIGRLLKYRQPKRAIIRMHKKYCKRLNKFSKKVRLLQPDGREFLTRIYNFRGLWEICRFSEQRNANAVIDFLWKLDEELKDVSPEDVQPDEDDFEDEDDFDDDDEPTGYTAEKLAEMFGVSPDDINRIAQENGLIPEYGTSNEYGAWVPVKEINHD